MKRESNVGVLLKGGLGNQLFQIAAGLYLNEGKSLEIFNNFTLPRQTAGVADALYFDWPQEIQLNNRESSKLEKKILAICLTRALATKSSPLNRFILKLIQILANFFFSLKFKAHTHVISGEGVGYSTVKLNPGLNLINGYFQSHAYASSAQVYSRIKEIRLKEKSSNLIRLIEEANQENPIIVHLRLGDYKNESGIGILSSDYYKKALKKIELNEVSKNIWIFTDEVESVDKFIYPSSAFNVRIIGENGLNPAELFELMRYGSAYVIANSTFSWWAAFLAYKSGCTRMMPSPWFQNMPSPIGIRPQDWIEIEFLKQ